MLKTMLGAIGLVAALSFTPTAPAQTMFRPIAIVNDSAITGFDLAQRAQILIALGFPTASPDALRAESLERLIEDRLKLQEGARLGLVADADSIDAGIEEFAIRSGLSVAEFRTAMSTQGVTTLALNDLVSAEVVWRQVVRSRFTRRVEPGEAEIDAEIALVQQRAGVSYRIAEIGLPADDAGRNAAETQALARKLYASLSQGGDFAAAVRTYSRAPSAPRGGEVGWISTAQMPPELAEALSRLSPGQVGEPFPVAGGYSILKLIEKRIDAADTIDASNPELRERVRSRLSSQRAARLAEGLLQELRRDALIELR
ncbi:MAG: peptidylprolyl isomerase [Proteobacteria bacterium]|nr:peptidylprolyl isomerase [Pseudomonadota bacterium]MCH8952806.1 peptidylprolyl isomerase [Pseudomonadota bacterium]